VLEQLGHADKRLLNGGIGAWTAAGGALETGPSAAAPAVTPYRGTPNTAVLATLERVTAEFKDPTTMLVDARSEPEYVDGHIPGAVHVEFTTNAAGTAPKVWKSAEELRALYAAAGVTPDKSVIPYCTTGVRSAVTYFTLRLLGYERVALFTGSWAEWSSHPELPRTTGDQP
jgi:thiosulfate/3-mercaptopyruvate sulfurtransferase